MARESKKAPKTKRSANLTWIIDDNFEQERIFLPEETMNKQLFCHKVGSLID